MKSILDYFPNGWTPTKLQADVLTELQLRWNSAEVFVLKLDVASGKSAVAVCIANWLAAKTGRASGARICTPTNVLVDQYVKLFPNVAKVKSAQNYYCEKVQNSCKGAKVRCKGCVYETDRKTASDAKVSISTYHMTKALRGYRGTMIFDEAHNLGSVIRDMHSQKLFLHKTFVPKECLDDQSLLEKWVLSLHEGHPDVLQLNDNEYSLLASYQKDLQTDQPLNFYTVETDWWSGGGSAFGEKMHRGESYEMPILKRQPLDVFTKPPAFWQENQKLILMSATVGRHDLYELGLDRTRPIFIEGDPPISFDRNPIIKDYLGTISYKNQASMLQPLADKIIDYLDNKKGKGVIHITYGLAKLLKPKLKHDRLITHDNTNMRAKLKDFLASDNGVFLVSGMYEGVSLDYNRADWQAISKIVWPSLQDPLQRYRSTDDPDYYLWSTLKNVIQASGRVCRRPDDFGETFVWDESFERLLTEGQHLVPASFRGRIK